MTDRLSKGYQPDWDIDLEVGKQGEMMVHNVVEALRAGSSIEVKTDEAASKWGRVYLESHCKKASGWAKSGLSATSAELWATVLEGDVIVIAPTWRFRHAGREAFKNTRLRKELVVGRYGRPLAVWEVVA